MTPCQNCDIDKSAGRLCVDPLIYTVAAVAAPFLFISFLLGAIYSKRLTTLFETTVEGEVVGEPLRAFVPAESSETLTLR